MSVSAFPKDAQRLAEERLFFHDIVNMAVSLRGLSEMMMGARQESDSHWPSAMHALSGNLLECIQNRRDVVLAEQQSISVKDEDLRAATIVAAVTRRTRRPCGQAEPALMAAADTADAAIRCDGELLQRVLGRLVANALEASHPDDTVTVGCRTEEATAILFVHNPGTIPSAISPRLFERFFSTKGAGRGVGLYGVRLITEQCLKGRVTWHSTEETGTVFEVRLPLDPNSVGREMDHATTFTGRRILLAEDNAVNRHVAARLLREAGLEAHCVTNGQEAVEALRSGSYDLVLMDCVMPVKDGIEACRDIRAIEAGEGNTAPAARIPIVAMTAHTEQEYLDRCREAGMDDYIAKPLRSDALLQLLRQWCAASNTDQPAAS